MHAPLGLSGWTDSDPRVFESKARSDRFGFCNHYGYLYLEELERLMRRVPPARPEINVLQDRQNVERIPADTIFWDTIQQHGGWKLQKNCSNGFFRIIDDYGIRRAWGSEAKMKESFADICSKLGK